MRVFLSYTRLKDQFNKVSEFRERLQQELELRDPGSQVFQDKVNLREGQHFPEELEQAVSQSEVFLALVSPAWLSSDWCRREFGLFTSEATDSSRLHRIVPVLWVETPEMRSNSLDLIARTIAPINYSDWRDLRYERWEEPASPAARWATRRKRARACSGTGDPHGDSKHRNANLSFQIRPALDGRWHAAVQSMWRAAYKHAVGNAPGLSGSSASMRLQQASDRPVASW